MNLLKLNKVDEKKKSFNLLLYYIQIEFNDDEHDVILNSIWAMYQIM